MSNVAIAAPSEINRIQWRTIILSSLGGALEFYDFVVFSTFAAYIGNAFFPSDNPTTGLLKSFMTFAVGYGVRPFGGVILAHFGDRFGRRKVLITSIAMMSAATIGIGLLPTYASWGLAAPICLIALRVMQGISLGGELPGAISYVVETSPRQAGFTSGVIFFCVNTGVAFAAILSLVLHATLGESGIAAWGWRIGFLFGGVMGILSFWLRLSLEESAEFSKLKHKASKRPFAELMKTAPVSALVGVMALAASGGLNGLLFAMPAFLPNVTAAGYLPQGVAYTGTQAAAAQNVGLLVLSFGLLGAAWLGDRVPRRLVLMTGSVLLMLGAFPFFSSLAAGTNHMYWLFIIAGACASFCNGPISGVVADLYRTRLRFSGVAVSFNLAFSIFSGLAPVLALLLVQRTGSVTSAAWYMVVSAAITFIATLVLHRFDGQILKEQAEHATTHTGSVSS
jgi:MFS family permease